MGRGDGRDRLVSGPDVDDTGAGILHVDMDAFYASVAVLDDPSLAGRALIVGGVEGRGVVASASYEARRFGVRSAMPVARALQLCPRAIVVPPTFDRYLALSSQVMAVFRDITPLVEPLSIDEAFLDVRGVRRLWGSPGTIAQMLRRRVKDETGLTCSVGAAATKHVAKMASTLSKPDGLLVVAEAETARFLEPRSIRALWGVGPKSADSLESRGIRTVGDVLRAPDAVLDRALGAAMGQRIRELARGLDAREVETTRVEKSIGHEETFVEDVDDAAVLRAELRRLADRVAARLRAHGWEATTVAVKIRFADFRTVSRSQRLREPTDVSRRLADAAVDQFDRVERDMAVRLVGVRAEGLRPATAAAALWDDDEGWRRIDGAIDSAATRFGSGAVTRAASLGGARRVGALPSHPRPARDDG